MKRQAADKHGHVAVNRVHTRLFQANSGEWQIHFLGHQHGQRRVNALPHLAAVHGQRHTAIGRHLDPAIQCHITLRRQHHGWGAQTGAGRQHAPTDNQGAGRAQGAQ